MPQATRKNPVLHRDDPAKTPLTGNVKVTRQDWINAALDTLVSDGVDLVKVMVLSERMGVSRSSFYWYFKSRKELLDVLLDTWQQMNTAALVAQAETHLPTITNAVDHVLRCMIDPSRFDTRLDFAVRDWARKDGAVRQVLDQSDNQRLNALTDMFARHGFAVLDAKARARILYFTQIGYTDADLREPMKERASLTAAYLFGFTGRMPSRDEVAAFQDFALGLE